MSVPSPDQRAAALARLVRDTRAEATPSLDWDRIEARLMEQATRSTPPERPRVHPLVWGGVAVAMAAAVAFWVGTKPAPSPTPSANAASEAATAASSIDGDTLMVGSRLTAGDRAVAVEHAQRARWTLAPGSSAVLARREARIVLRLEGGSVLSKVVPSPQPETFVVEAAGVRVAVHGTLFRVAVEGDRVVVDVTEGVVGVGPLTTPSAHFITAGSHADLAADGQSGTIDGKPFGSAGALTDGPAKPRAAWPLNAAPPSAHAAPSPTAPLPVEPTINDIEDGIAPAVDATTKCFATHTQSNDGVKITVRTALSLKILESGAVTDIDFEPPLAPDVEACAKPGIAHVRFAPSQHGTTVTRVLELTR